MMLFSVLALLGTVSGAPLDTRQIADPCAALVGVDGCKSSS